MTTLNLSPSSAVTVRRSTPDALEVEVVYEPGSPAPPQHFHPDQAEHFEVLEGSVTTLVERTERVLDAGDTLDIPPRAVHQMWNAGDVAARVLWRTSPPGRTLAWFEALDAFQRDGDGAALGAAIAEYRDVLRLVEG